MVECTNANLIFLNHRSDVLGGRGVVKTVIFVEGSREAGMEPVRRINCSIAPLVWVGSVYPADQLR